MIDLVSIKIFILCIIVLLFLNSCKENSTAPQDSESSPLLLSGGQFHGTWLSQYIPRDSLKMTFDSTTMRFIDQYGYNYGIRREFQGTYSVTASKLSLNYDYGIQLILAYQLNSDILSLTDSYSARRNFTRIDTIPSYYGWSKKLKIISEHTFSYIPTTVQSYCYSDSSGIAFAILDYDHSRYLLGIDNMGMTILGSANGIIAMDARRAFLWVVTDSTIVKRTISDSAIISSFNYRNVFGLEYHASGIAIDSEYCFLMTVSSVNYQGILLKYTLGGVLLNIIRTDGVIKDLCLANGRLFCISGDETFYELNTSTGQVAINYSLLNRPFGNNIDGVAFTGNALQFASRDSCGRLRISYVNIP
jgi:hypothetical protein